MFLFNPLFNLRRALEIDTKGRKDKTRKASHKEHKVKTMDAGQWNNVAGEIQQSIQEVLAKYGVTNR
jgi:hypothetical protein